MSNYYLSSILSLVRVKEYLNRFDWSKDLRAPLYDWLVI